MISVRLLLFPLAMYVVLLMPKHVVRCLDAGWGDTPIEVLFYSALDDSAGDEGPPNACVRFPCLIVASPQANAPGDD